MDLRLFTHAGVERRVRTRLPSRCLRAVDLRSACAVLMLSSACGDRASGAMDPQRDTIDASAAAIAWVEAGGNDADVDVASCTIISSGYDTSCATDSDCVAVAGNFVVVFGDWCHSNCLCGGNAINRSSAVKYARDVAQTPLGSGAVASPGCGCATFEDACCQGGTCTSGLACQVPTAPDATSGVDVEQSSDAGPACGASTCMVGWLCCPGSDAYCTPTCMKVTSCPTYGNTCQARPDAGP